MDGSSGLAVVDEDVAWSRWARAWGHPAAKRLLPGVERDVATIIGNVDIARIRMSARNRYLLGLVGAAVEHADAPVR